MGEEAYNSHVRDPFLEFSNPIGNGRVGDDNQERVYLVFLRSEITDQRRDLNTVIQLSFTLRRAGISLRFTQAHIIRQDT
jgi:hypothetical protein